MNYALVGYGRMGREVEAEAGRRGHRLVAIVDPSAEGARLRRRVDSRTLGKAEAAFEFTNAAAAEANVVALLQANVPVVCGTTGWAPTGSRLRQALRDSRAGLVHSPNFSVGMNLFYRVVREAARLFAAPGLHDPFVLEAHHRGKADAPSGTARRLCELVMEADPRVRSVQEGNPEGPLAPGALHVASVRAGHEPGTHTVGFDGAEDAVTLTHRARGRAGFAVGAVLAAEWLLGRKGFHSFDQVLDDLLKGRKKGGRR